MVKKYLLSGILSGLLIGIGGAVFLGSDDRYVGALLFCVALLSICYFGFSLYTGKIGFIVVNHKKENFVELICCLIGNFIGAVCTGKLIAYALPARVEKAYAMCSGKLEQPLLAAFLLGCFCGVLMYVAVAIWKERQTMMGVLFCIPVFVISGFEHSIADMFYFSVSGIVSAEAFGYIGIIILGNSVGAMVPLALRTLAEGAKNA